MSTIWTTDGVENKHDVYRGKGCMKKFCESLKEPTIKIINFEKKKVIPLTNEERESYRNQTNFPFANKKFEVKYTNDKKYRKVRDHCHYGGEHNICNLKYSIPKEIPVVCHNGLNYDYQFIMKEQEKYFQG